MKLPKAMSISAIAVVIGKHRGTLQRWLSIYQAEGLSGLLCVKQSPSRPRVIPAWAVKRLQEELTEPYGKWREGRFVRCLRRNPINSGGCARVTP